MANYTYRCDKHGPSVSAFPVGTAPQHIDCTECGQPAKRIYSSPNMSTADPTMVKLIDSTHASSERPDVYGSVPEGRRINPTVTRMAPPNPRLRKLPRP